MDFSRSLLVTTAFVLTCSLSAGYASQLAKRPWTPEPEIAPAVAHASTGAGGFTAINTTTGEEIEISPFYILGEGIADLDNPRIRDALLALDRGVLYLSRT